MKKRILSALLAASLTASVAGMAVFAAEVEEPTVAVEEEVAEETAEETDIVEKLIAQDVAADAWYAPAVEAVITAELMDLVGENFAPTANIDRQTVAETLFRMAKMMNMDLSAMTGMAVKEMTDFVNVAGEKRAGVAFAFDAGIMTGNGDGTLTPTAALTPQESAAMLQRFVQSLAQK